MNFSTVTVPPVRVLCKIQKEGQPPGLGIRRMASTSTPPKRDVFELGPRSESRNSLNFDRRQPQQSRAYNGKSNFVWPFHKSGSLETTTTTTTTRKSSLNERSGNNNSLPTTTTTASARVPKIRVVGRGGSGSKLRQVSLSNPAVVVLESESSSCLRQPHDQESLFYRPTGRGGLGSRRSTGTNPPTAMKPFKPPTAMILDLIRGRKRSEVQLNEHFKIHKSSSTPRRSQSLYYRPQKDSFTRIVTRTGSNSLDDPSGTSILELERPAGASISQNIHHPDDNKDTDSYFEEEIYRTANEHRERSLNKLTRTLGAHPSSLLPVEGSSKSPIFDNFSSKGDRFIGQRSHHHHHHHHPIWDSFESEESDDDDDDDTHSDTRSPITFASTSADNTTYHHHHSEQQTHTRLASTTASDVLSNFTTTSSTRENNSAQSHHSSPPEKSPAMPRLHISTHSDAISVPNNNDDDDNVVVPDLTAGPVTKEKSGWLVPLNEVVISIRRTAPSKPQSWTGEWNREIKDVIKDLRRL